MKKKLIEILEELEPEKVKNGKGYRPRGGCPSNHRCLQPYISAREVTGEDCCPLCSDYPDEGFGCESDIMTCEACWNRTVDLDAEKNDKRHKKPEPEKDIFDKDDVVIAFKKSVIDGEWYSIAFGKTEPIEKALRNLRYECNSGVWSSRMHSIEEKENVISTTAIIKPIILEDNEICKSKKACELFYDNPEKFDHEIDWGKVESGALVRAWKFGRDYTPRKYLFSKYEDGKIYCTSSNGSEISLSPEICELIIGEEINKYRK